MSPDINTPLRCSTKAVTGRADTDGLDSSPMKLYLQRWIAVQYCCCCFFFFLNNLSLSQGLSISEMVYKTNTWHKEPRVKKRD